ncbi:hypothetical protein LFT44_09670 [Arthrobacter sp. FW306-05-C]|uniref:hypothetical protein n=1 Tax=unclassified Arthrobacter TaxID=235627 RepID=UPI001EF0949F|nr:MULTISPECIES: hypothetical protein [unclassified Arthrobacter]UKA68624.1 hypothetical protein LFT44_09670 [Arthrobacter sp. FW306-05-C]UKA72988.1 hypothetical protein LFT49_09825 [Arthrobacter sp. FW306-06-A]UKA77258.1 hypothetical protein LFT46_09670 [Arthrobacter sp. FW306-07-I]
MGAIFGTALSLMLTVGGAAVAAEGGPGAAQHYLAGHVLLGVGIGLLIATILRTAVRILLARRTAPADKTTAAAAGAEPATVTVLPVRSTAPMPMRGRHAA